VAEVFQMVAAMAAMQMTAVAAMVVPLSWVQVGWGQVLMQVLMQK
jgi:hypothetical protein